MKSEIINKVSEKKAVVPAIFKYVDWHRRGGSVYLCTGPRGGVCIVGGGASTLGHLFSEDSEGTWDSLVAWANGNFITGDLTVKFTAP